MNEFEFYIYDTIRVFSLIGVILICLVILVIIFLLVVAAYHQEK